MNYKLKADPGAHFEKVAEQAITLAGLRNIVVEFVFNEITCIVNASTDPQLIFRDYCNAHLMGWGAVGPDCVAEYTPNIQGELKARTEAMEKRQEEQRKEWDRKDAIERDAFTKKTEGVTIELADVDAWNKGKNNNIDPYGAAIFDYAESWAKLMQVEIAKGQSLRSVAEKTSFELGFLGITGFMYGAAVSILSKCWRHGEELRKWHNKEYGHEGEGVVNPAILTLK